MRLSVGQAWIETRKVIARDGKVIALVALALLVLPGTLVGLAAPGGTQESSVGIRWLAFLAGLLSIVGQIAISRIALGPPLTVGASIRTGLTRLPMFVAAFLLWVLPFAALIAVLLTVGGADVSNPSAAVEKPNLAIGLLLLIAFIGFIYVALRMLFVTPAAAASELGPVNLIKQSWQRSKGRVLKLFGILLLLALSFIVLVFGLGSAVSAVVLLLVGPAEPWSLSALLIALVQQLLGAIVSAGFAVLLARCYVQVSSAEHGHVSVPDAGHH